MGQASICGGSGLLRTLVVALAGGRQRRDGCARAGGRGQARARPASPADERRWWLPGEALVELEGWGGLEQRIGGGIVLGIGGRRQWRAAGGCDAGWRGRFAEVGEDVADNRKVGDEGDDPHLGAAVRVVCSILHHLAKRLVEFSRRDSLDCRNWLNPPQFAMPSERPRAPVHRLALPI